MMVNLNHNLKFPYIPNHPHGILRIGGSGSGKTYVLWNFIKHQLPDFDKIYLYVKDPFEQKYQLLFNGREKVGITQTKNRKAFIDYHTQLMMSMKIYNTIIHQGKEKC